MQFIEDESECESWNWVFDFSSFSIAYPIWFFFIEFIVVSLNLNCKRQIIMENINYVHKDANACLCQIESARWA